MIRVRDLQTWRDDPVLESRDVNMASNRLFHKGLELPSYQPHHVIDKPFLPAQLTVRNYPSIANGKVAALKGSKSPEPFTVD